MQSRVTLSIDFGYKNIGLALARNQEGINTPLFAGTILYDPYQLSVHEDGITGDDKINQFRDEKKREIRYIYRHRL